MALGLAADGFQDRLAQRLVALAGAQRRAQVGGILLPQAHIQRAGAGQPHAVAAFAEIMRQRGDETQLAAGFLNLDIARRPAGLVGDVGQGEALRQLLAHQRQRQVLVHPVLIAEIAHRHDLDDRHVVAEAAAPGQHVAQLVLVHALQRDGVDLDLQPGRLGGGDAVQHLLEIAPAGDGGEFRRVQRVQRDVQPAHAGVIQLGCVFAELGAVGGQRQLVQPAALQMPAQAADQAHDIAADQRLAAGQAQLAHPHIDEGTAQPVQLLQRQHVLLRQEGHVLRHAIDAAQIAAVSDGNPEI